MNYISNFLTVDKSLDDLHNMYKFFSKNNSIKSNDIDNSKENYLGTNSNLYIKCKEILDLDMNPQHKQIALEKFILDYEKQFTANIITNMSDSISDYKLLTRIFKHSKGDFTQKVITFIENNKKRNYALYDKNKNDISKMGENLALALFIAIKSDQLINIIFSKVIRIIGLSGGITQNELLGNLSEEMLILLKYNLKKNNKILENLSEQEVNIIKDIEDKLDELPH